MAYNGENSMKVEFSEYWCLMLASSIYYHSLNLLHFFIFIVEKVNKKLQMQSLFLGN